MLPAAARLRRREEFAEVVRRGRRTVRGPLVVHALVSRETVLAVPSDSPRVGFVIGKVVGPAVVRNRLRRRLRHLLRARVGALPPSARLVVRAQPGAGDLSSARLGELLDAALPKVLAS